MNLTEVNRRDFLKLGSRLLGILGLLSVVDLSTISCDGMEDTKILDYKLEDIDEYISFPSSPFHHKELEPAGTTIEEFGNNNYRVISQELGPGQRLGLFNRYVDQGTVGAENAVNRMLDQYEKVIQIQEKIYTDETKTNYSWKTLNIAGSPQHSRQARDLEENGYKYLKPEWQIDDDTYFVASAQLHTAMYDSSLDEATRANIFNALLNPESVDLISNFSSDNRSQGTKIDPIPESLPIELWADIHTAIFAPPEPSAVDDWDSIMDIISPKAGTENCIFVPKKSKELQETLEHVTSKEFFDLPGKPLIYFVTEKNNFGTTNKIYITSDDQSRSYLYNHNIMSPYQEKEWISEAKNWRKLEYPGQAKNLTDIHGVEVNSNTEIYQLSEDQIGYYLIPNKFKGSPKLFEKEPKVRIAAGIKTLKNFPGSNVPDNPQIMLFGKDVFDMISAVHYQNQDWQNWITEVTESCKVQIAKGVQKHSKLGLIAPNEFFYKLFMTREENLGLNLPHESIIPQEPILEKVMLDAFISAQQQDTDIHQFNWAFGTGSPVPIYELSGVNTAALWNKFGIKDKINDAEMKNEKGENVTLKPGEAMPFGEIIEDVDGNKWILLARVQRDDNGAFYSNFVNKYFADKINQSFAIRYEDALKYICPLDPNNNILDASEKILKVSAITSTVLLTLFAPEVLPAAALAGSLSISSKFNTLVSVLRAAGLRAFTRFIP